MTVPGPDLSPNPTNPMFHWDYWKLLVEKVVRGGAGGGIAGWVITNHHLDWGSVGTGIVVGAVFSALLSLSSDTIPNTLPQSFAKATPAARDAATFPVRTDGKQ